MTPLLDVAAVQARLETQRLGRSMEFHAETGSTNDDARRAIERDVADGHVVVADCQRAGRGSRGRTWVSPAGKDLYFSVVARVPIDIVELPCVTLAVGVAVAEALEAVTAISDIQVKWPNDIWIQSKKCCGILVESTSVFAQAQPLVIGIGVNVNRRVFPDGLDNTPTSLALECSVEQDRSHVLAAVLNRLERWIDRFIEEGSFPVVEALQRRLALRGTEVECEGVVGILEGISPKGALLLRCGTELRELVSGTLRPRRR